MAESLLYHITWNPFQQISQSISSSSAKQPFSKLKIMNELLLLTYPQGVNQPIIMCSQLLQC